MAIALLESSRPSSRESRVFLVSVFAHVILLGGVLTRDAWTAAEPLRGPEVVVLQVPRTPDPPTMVRRAPSSASNTPASAFALPSLLPVPPFDPPPVVPPDLPALRSTDPGWDEALFDRRRFADSPHGMSGDDTALRGNNPLDASMVDIPVTANRDNPIPRYPSVLASAGIEGSVLMTFVVDTLGVVEKQSVVAVKASHPMFEQAVREALVRMRFTSAQVRGHKVRQLVEQAFSFAIKR